MSGLTISLATERDVDEILELLLEEYDAEAGVGFYGNRNLIRAGAGSHLWVARQNPDLVGFYLGAYSPSILWVKPDRRNEGIGAKMFTAALNRAFEDNVNAMEVECMPTSSLGFWMRQGFVPLGPADRPWAPVIARRVLTRSFETDQLLPSVKVQISFYPESALYEGRVPPGVEAELIGRRDGAGNISLPERVIGSGGGGTERDTAVKICVDERQLYFDKAKYAERFGVHRDSEGNTFYIDQVLSAGIGN